MGVLFALLLSFLGLASSQGVRYDNPRANLSTVWRNDDSLSTIEYTRDVIKADVVRPILRYSEGGFGDRYACGFYKNASSAGYYFGVFIVYLNSGARITYSTISPQPVWVANRNRAVGENATLELTPEGDLVLRNESRMQVWSTSTGGKGVAYMEIQGTGNLVLSNSQGKHMWQSFDHPAGVLVLGQVLKLGMKLVSSVSDGNLSEGPYSLAMTANGSLVLSAQGSPPQVYWSTKPDRQVGDILPYALFTNGSILLFATSESVRAYASSRSANDSDGAIKLPQAASEAQYLQILPNGDFGAYVKDYNVTDIRANGRRYYSILGAGDCSVWPGSCGTYSVCNAGQCSCLESEVASDSILNDRNKQSSGCRPALPLSTCGSNSSGAHHFFSVYAGDYVPIRFNNVAPIAVNATLDACQEICSKNCSCKMSIFDVSLACYTFDEVYTLRNYSSINPTGDTTNAPLIQIKMQNQSRNAVVPSGNQPESDPKSKTRIILPILLPILGVIIIVVLSIFWYKMHVQRRRDLEELALDAMAGLPKRLSYRQLQDATSNFSKKLGQGGFGAVFFGELEVDDEEAAGENRKIQVAVKRLESVNQGHREFRTEVSIIASVRHLNLVELKGFCAENDHRLLVYELIANGSLDRWLFKPKAGSDAGNFLNWDRRCKIALGTARGLAYLHEECKERILHLDIKTQNILLDPYFNAKVCDFGLSKLMKRDESAVFTTMRGTPGYLAPEWLQSSITEKVDVYSFGIVLLELVSGERCIDAGRGVSTSSRLHFPSWAQAKVLQGADAMELLDKRLELEMRGKPEMVRRMVDIAFFCIQEEPASRPSMKSVVQMLENLQQEEDGAAPAPSSFEDETCLLPR